MNLNLHGTVRGAINSVSQDIAIIYIRSTGNTVSANGKQTPTYASPVTIKGNVQPIGNSDLQKYNFLQAQGVHRRVWLYGDVEAIVRQAQTGADLLKFPIVPGGTVTTWLVRVVPETWGVGWCSVVVTQQLDPNNP